ncbi:ribosome-inactivating family protein [Streptomyces sp. CG1]|uniref:ribosome-inactivating family protein n=1 Tax=Streptomyces sp. CG1 TaxID=1287523 RepID=UPI0034E21EAB
MSNHHRQKTPSVFRRVSIGIATAAVGSTVLGIGVTTVQAAEPDQRQHASGIPSSSLSDGSTYAANQAQGRGQNAGGQDEQGSGNSNRSRRDLTSQQSIAVEFSNADSATPQEYLQFVNRVRNAVSEDGPSATYNANRYSFRQTRQDPNPISVRLSTGEGNSVATVDLLIRPSDLYVVGWRNQNRNYWMADAGAVPQGFEEAGFRFTYPQERATIPLGQQAMVQAIHTMTRDASVSERERAMTVLAQMVSEATRFNGIAQSISGLRSSDSTSHRDRPERWYTGSAPAPAVLDMENNWGALSVTLADLQNGQPPRNPISVNGTLIDNAEQLSQLLSVANRNSLTTNAPLMPQAPELPGRPGGESKGSEF